LFALLALVGYFSLGVLDSLGGSADAGLQQKFLQSKNYDRVRGGFVNPNQSEMDDAQRRATNWRNIRDYFLTENQREPAQALPQKIPDYQRLLAEGDGLKLIWFGHSSFLLNMEGTVILVDPVFGNASPFKFFGNRYMPPVSTVEQLPQIDVVLISHDHYDHLEADTVRYFADKDTNFVVPLGLGAHLSAWGIETRRIVERDWWESVEHGAVTFTATPSQHYSGRRGFGGNQSLWASWVMQSGRHSVYFSGDSGYAPHFNEIGDRFGPFDIAFIETGQYNEAWRMIHMLPEDGVMAFRDLNAQRYFPVHWGMFTLALHSWFEPIETISRLAEQEDFPLVAPVIGQLVDVSSDTHFPRWWERRPGR
jgi:L-ascorbate metabolism protein UlaG (beta-lactamase superfamily)